MAQVDDAITGGDWIIELVPQRPLPVIVARSVVTPRQGQFPVRILNLGDDNIDLHRGTRLAKAEQLDQNDVTITAIAQAGDSTLHSTKGSSSAVVYATIFGRQ